MRIATFLILCLSLASNAFAAGTDWKAGAAQAKITPEGPMWMAGYAARNKPSEGVAQDLFAKALALEDAAGNRVVMLTMDLIGIPRALRKSLEARARQELKLPPQNLLLNASHTHCGPEFRVQGVPGDDAFGRDAQGALYGRKLEEMLFKLMAEAIGKLEPATVSRSFARCGFAMNRRLPVGNDYRNSPFPEGPVDHEVPVMKVVGADGKTRAIAFGYACHNTTLGFYQFCGDYAGYAQEFLQADHPGAVALFVTGCGGDQNPYPRGTIELVKAHGRTLATAVNAALGSTLRPVSGTIACAMGEIDLPYAPVPGREQLKERLASKDQYEVRHAKRLLEKLDKGEALSTTYPYPVQVIRLGEGDTVIALGGEVVVDYALRLKKDYPPGRLWMAGYSNDVMGYIPSKRVLKEGGYEGGGAMRFSSTHPGPWDDSVEEKIIGKVRELSGRLKP